MAAAAGAARARRRPELRPGWRQEGQEGEGQPPLDKAAFELDPALGLYSPFMMHPALGFPLLYPFGAAAWSPYASMAWAESGRLPTGAFPDSSPTVSRTKSSASSLGRSKSLRSDAETPAAKSKGGKKKKAKQQEAASPEAAAELPDSPECNFSLEAVMPKLLETARDPQGCRFIHSCLIRDDVPHEDKAAIATGLCASAVELSTAQPLGGAVVIELLELATAEQRRELLAALAAAALGLALDAQGCRVLQRLLELAPRETLARIAAELQRDVDGCIESLHGNHVIQKCVERMPPDCLAFIIKAAEAKAVTMASHPFGCRVLQRLLEHCTTASLAKVLDDLLQETAKLAQDAYANYVIQHVLQHGRKEDKQKIIRVVEGNLVAFATSKCSSNVVDKCFEVATSGEHAQALEPERAALMRAALGEGAAAPPAPALADDRWGSYIVQRVAQRCRPAERERLLAQLAAAEPLLGVKGRRVLAQLQQQCGPQAAS